LSRVKSGNEKNSFSTEKLGEGLLVINHNDQKIKQTHKVEKKT